MGAVIEHSRNGKAAPVNCHLYHRQLGGRKIPTPKSARKNGKVVVGRIFSGHFGLRGGFS